MSGIRATTIAIAADALQDALRLARLEPQRLRHAARAWPPRRVLALAIERTDVPNVLPAAREELLRSHHEVQFASAPAADRGKFENLNALLQDHPVDGRDWLLVVDDDVVLPSGFVDVFVFLAERFGLQIAQPAHRRRSHAAWAVTRRHFGSVARETAFVEIGPVFAFQSPVFETLLPFPALRIGWGLDAHWSAVARSNSWRLGVIDAAPVRHGMRRIAASYGWQTAVDEARSFLRARPYVTAHEAQQTLVTHRGWR